MPEYYYRSKLEMVTEFARWLQRQPDGEFNIEIGNNNFRIEVIEDAQPSR